MYAQRARVVCSARRTTFWHAQCRTGVMSRSVPNSKTRSTIASTRRGAGATVRCTWVSKSLARTCWHHRARARANSPTREGKGSHQLPIEEQYVYMCGGIAEVWGQGQGARVGTAGWRCENWTLGKEAQPRQGESTFFAAAQERTHGPQSGYAGFTATMG